MSRKITFVGGGNMTRSLVAGLVAGGYPAGLLAVVDPNDKKRTALAEHFGVQVHEHLEKAATEAEIIILAVKPPIVPEVVNGLAPTVHKNHPLLISIAAGVRIAHVHKWLGRGGERISVIRCMPNTPARVGAGATALYAGARVSEAEKDIAASILRAVGLTVWLQEEAKMDVVTALSGSGPAYFFRIMEAIQNAGEELGLTSEQARLLTLQTAMGAARMALESEQSFQALCSEVASPGGTTEKALQVLDAAGIDCLFNAVLLAAKSRSNALSTILDGR